MLGLVGAKRDDYLEDARSLVRGYFELEDPREVDAVGVELRLEATLGDAVRTRSTSAGSSTAWTAPPSGDLVVVDYKTGRAPAPGRERTKLAAVETYALLCERVLGVRPVAVRLLHLREPLVIERRVGEAEVAPSGAPNGPGLGRHRARARLGRFRPSPGPLCRYCAFSDRCEGAALAR